MARKRKPRRQDLGSGEVLCAYCTAKCCRYFALPLETPSTWGDFDDLRWFLAHDRTAIFVEEKTWYLLIQTRCKYLTADNRCGIYDDRMRTCRKYSTADCEYDDEVYEKYFDSPEQIWEYAEALLPPRRGQRRRPKSVPDRLPILALHELPAAARNGYAVT